MEIINVTILNNVFCKTDKAGKKLLDPCLVYKKTYWKQTQNRKIEESYYYSMIGRRYFFLTGFLPRIEKFCKEKGYTLLIEKPVMVVPPNDQQSFQSFLEKTKTLLGNDFRENQLEKQISLIRAAVDQKRGLLISPTGTGKTTLALGIASYFPTEKTLYMCHTKTLVTQTAKEFERYGFLVTKVMEGNKDQSGNIVVATRQSLISMELEKYGVVMVDECFAKGTKIATPNGKLPIENIKQGDIVFTKSGENITTKIFSSKIPLENVIKLKLNNGKEIFCSKDHLFAVQNKWVPAKQLLKKDYLYTLRDMMYYITTKTEVTCNATEKSKTLPNLWKKSLYAYKILLKKMRVFQSTKKKNSFQNNDKNELEIRFRKNEKKQSFLETRSCRKTKNDKKNKWDLVLGRHSWWEWNRTNTIRKSIVSSLGEFLEKRICSENISKYFNRKKKKRNEKRKIPNKLQNRYCKSLFKNWYRNRWKNTQLKNAKRTGFEKNKKIDRTWVENIEIYKQGSNDKSFSSIISNKERSSGHVTFYDLEIENEHNYFVEGVLVHNCHHISDENCSYGTILQKIDTPLRFGFTATFDEVKLQAKFAIEGNIGQVVGELTMEKAQEMKILAKPKLHIIKVPRQFIDSRNYQDVYNEAVVYSRTRNRLIVKTIKGYTDKNKIVLVFVTKLAHGKEIQKIALSIYNMKIEMIQGITETSVREEIKQSLKDKKTKAIIATTVWTEGVNIPALDCIILASGGKSELELAQKMGRGMRLSEGKNEMVLVDFIDNVKYLENHCLDRLTFYIEKGWLK